MVQCLRHMMFRGTLKFLLQQLTQQITHEQENGNNSREHAGLSSAYKLQQERNNRTAKHRAFLVRGQQTLV